MMWLLETALIVLLAATLFHAIRLERALGVLKRDRAALESLVDGFNSSTRAAEQGIDRLRSAADGAGRQIARQTETASGLKDDLLFLIERGERLADRMDALVRAARPLAPEPARPETYRPDAYRGEPARFEPEATGLDRRDRTPPASPYDPDAIDPLPLPPSPQPGLGTDPPRVRSQAERDLLRALRLAR